MVQNKVDDLTKFLETCKYNKANNTFMDFNIKNYRYASKIQQVEAREGCRLFLNKESTIYSDSQIGRYITLSDLVIETQNEEDLDVIYHNIINNMYEYNHHNDDNLNLWDQDFYTTFASGNFGDEDFSEYTTGDATTEIVDLPISTNVAKLSFTSALISWAQIRRQMDTNYNMSSYFILKSNFLRDISAAQTQIGLGNYDLPEHVYGYEPTDDDDTGYRIHTWYDRVNGVFKTKRDNTEDFSSGSIDYPMTYVVVNMVSQSFAGDLYVDNIDLVYSTDYTRPDDMVHLKVFNGGGERTYNRKTDIWQLKLKIEVEWSSIK
jgi:hypothetical protein